MEEITRVVEHQDDILRMEKLEKRKETQRILKQRADEQLMITMMQNMFQGSNVQPQRLTIAILLYSPAITAQGTTQAPISASQTENDLVISMEKINLAQTSDESTKRLKTGDNMNTRGHPPLILTAIPDSTPTVTMRDAESQFLPGAGNKGTSQSEEINNSTL